MKDKIKELWADLVEKVGADWAIAVVVGFALAVLVHPVLGVVVGAGYVAWKRGALDDVVEKIKAKFSKE